MAEIIPEENSQWKKQIKLATWDGCIAMASSAIEIAGLLKQLSMLNQNLASTPLYDILNTADKGFSYTALTAAFLTAFRLLSVVRGRRLSTNKTLRQI